MRRSVVILTFVLLLIPTIAIPTAEAGGGGHGCREGFEDGASTTVITEGVCFLPTVVRIEAGDTVEFKNPDVLPHTVGGIAGSFGDLYKELGAGESVIYRFTEEGVYPYACMFHPGMGGAVVVGDGAGKAVAGGAVEVAPPAETEPQPVVGSREAASDRPWLVPLGIALGVAVLGAAVIPGRRRAGSAAL